jgi:hypothetical protein
MTLPVIGSNIISNKLNNTVIIPKALVGHSPYRQFNIPGPHIIISKVTPRSLRSLSAIRRKQFSFKEWQRILVSCTFIYATVSNFHCTVQDLEFSQLCCCIFKSSGTRCYVIKWVISSIIKGHTERLIHPEDEGIVLLQNVWNFSPYDTV